MKTLRFRTGSLVKPGILDSDSNIRDASSLVNDWDSSTVKKKKLDGSKYVDLIVLYY